MNVQNIKKLILITLLLLPVSVQAKSIKVEASGQYTGPLETTPSPDDNEGAFGTCSENHSDA